MSGTPGSLIGAMIGCRTTHSRRQCGRLFRTNGAKEAHDLFNHAQSFFHPPFRLPGKNALWRSRILTDRKK